MSPRRSTTTAVALGTAAGVALAARWGARRRAALDGIRSDLRTPITWAPLPVNPAGLPLMRRMMAGPAPLTEGVTPQWRRVTVPDRESADIVLYRPLNRDTPGGALVLVHGGGFVMGSAEGYHDVCSRFAAELGVLVVSVDYRCAPEHPFPAPLEDCYTALAWVHGHAEELGVDPARIAIGGHSAGGGLAASLAQLAHDRGEVPVCFQLLVYPMLDDRTVLRTDHSGRGVAVWTPSANEFGWRSYLGHDVSARERHPYAAASRRTDLAGLPPAWIGVGDLDLFHDEDVDYAARLLAAGVECELHVVPGMYHAAEKFRPQAPSMVDFVDRQLGALRAAFAVGTPDSGAGAQRQVDIGPDVDKGLARLKRAAEGA